MLTYVDDATSRLRLLRLVEGETTFDYLCEHAGGQGAGRAATERCRIVS
ncbi:MAG TPA: hypothetical protein VMV25_00735 [Steroidobacteraceae bacterium]|nr:hypothetical protein [Steroidobacteraceae bacterium]